MDSVMQSEKVCYMCGRNGYSDELESHHCMGGNNRKWSEKYGLKVWLCGNRCHRNGKQSAHQNSDVALKLKQDAQRKFEETHTREEFREIFGKSYL